MDSFIYLGMSEQKYFEVVSYKLQSTPIDKKDKTNLRE